MRATYPRAYTYYYVCRQQCVCVYTWLYKELCEAVCATLIPLILRRHACCSCLSEMRHRRRRSSRNKKALRGSACMHRVQVCMRCVYVHLHRVYATERTLLCCAVCVIGCLEAFRIFFLSLSFFFFVRFSFTSRLFEYFFFLFFFFFFFVLFA